LGGTIGSKEGGTKNGQHYKITIFPQMNPVLNIIAQKWAIEIIALTWELIHNLWLKRNEIEHDVKGHPEQRKKDKIIEIVRGESIRMDYEVYSKEELENETLGNLPIENLNMIKQNLKDAKSNKRKNHTIL
jgi:hypothetical protein